MKESMIDKSEILNMLENINSQLNELERVLSTSVSEYKGEMYDDQVRRLYTLDELLLNTEKKVAQENNEVYDQATVLRRRAQLDKGFKLELGF